MENLKINSRLSFSYKFFTLNNLAKWADCPSFYAWHNLCLAYFYIQIQIISCVQFHLQFSHDYYYNTELTIMMTMIIIIIISSMDKAHIDGNYSRNHFLYNQNSAIYYYFTSNCLMFQPNYTVDKISYFPVRKVKWLRTINLIYYY